jgi:hypothetical protein
MVNAARGAGANTPTDISGGPALRFKFRGLAAKACGTLAMVCRVILAGRVRIEKGRCFLKKMDVHRGKPDAARQNSIAR